ncbi:MAG: alpha/beta fold hydrolase [Acidobacteriota bacterium]|nr:alpha/beta fold hydrolase [Acidobacteriota bacterium]
MRTVSYALLVAALLASPQMAAAQSIDAGRGDVALTVPASYSRETATPLIVLLHGFGSSGDGQDEYMKFSALVDTYGFILATPDGTAAEGDVFGMKNPRFWNATKACCNFGGMAVDDSTYLSGLIDKIKAVYRIDDKRVFLVGHSNGGFMSYRLARDHPATIAAIVSLAGADDPEAPATTANPVHVLQIHGTADETISYGGGDIQGVGSYTGAERTVEGWATRNGCDASGMDVGTVDLVGTLEGPETSITRYTSSCQVGGSAELWTIAEGSHVPGLSEHFSPLVVEWLMGHPKP